MKGSIVGDSAKVEKKWSSGLYHTFNHGVLLPSGPDTIGRFTVVQCLTVDNIRKRTDTRKSGITDQSRNEGDVIIEMMSRDTRAQ